MMYDLAILGLHIKKFLFLQLDFILARLSSDFNPISNWSSEIVYTVQLIKNHFDNYTNRSGNFFLYTRRIKFKRMKGRKVVFTFASNFGSLIRSECLSIKIIDISFNVIFWNVNLEYYHLHWLNNKEPMV